MDFPLPLLFARKCHYPLSAPGLLKGVLGRGETLVQRASHKGLTNLRNLAILDVTQHVPGTTDMSDFLKRLAALFPLRQAATPVAAENTNFDQDPAELRLRSKAISQSASGKLSVDIGVLSQTRKFQHDLKILKDIANTYRKQHGVATPE